MVTRLENDSDKSTNKAVKATYDLYTSVGSAYSNKVSGKENLSIKSFKLEVQNSMKKIINSVKKSKVYNLMSVDKVQKDSVFELGNKRFTEQQKVIALKNISKWEPSEEINIANASVVVSWLEKFGKIK